MSENPEAVKEALALLQESFKGLDHEEMEVVRSIQKKSRRCCKSRYRHQFQAGILLHH